MTSAAPERRDYQARGVEQIRAHFRNGTSRVCYQLPTGGGKTVLFVHIATAYAATGRRSLILCHRDEILRQVAKALTEGGISFGIIAAGYPASPVEAIQVASVFTVTNRIGDIGDFDIVIIDEAHHAVASTWGTILDAFPAAIVLGVTATPERLDGKGLDDYFR